MQRIYCAVTRHISSAQQIILTSVRATTEVGSGIERARLRRTFPISECCLSFFLPTTQTCLQLKVSRSPRRSLEPPAETCQTKTEHHRGHNRDAAKRESVAKSHLRPFSHSGHCERTGPEGAGRPELVQSPGPISGLGRQRRPRTDFPRYSRQPHQAAWPDCEISAEKRTPIRLRVPKPGRHGTATLGKESRAGLGAHRTAPPGPPARHISGKARKG